MSRRLRSQWLASLRKPARTKASRPAGSSYHYRRRLQMERLEDRLALAAPSDISPDLLPLVEHTATGTMVRTLIVTDPDASDTHGFEIVNQEHAGAFALSTSGQLTVANGSLLDFATDPSHALTVRVTDQDGAGLSYQETITVALAQSGDVIVTTFAGAGGSFGYTGDGGPAIAAKVGGPRGITVDPEGNVYFADHSNWVVRRVDAQTGIITTVAGNGVSEYSGDGGPATAAGLFSPLAVALDQDGNIYIADNAAHRIRRVDAATGIISTVAGNGLFGFSGDGGPATDARLNSPQGVAVDTLGNLYIAEISRRVRRVDVQTGIITTIAGIGGPPGFSGDGGPATQANFTDLRGVAVDSQGNVFILERSNSSRIRQVDAVTGIINTVAGGGTSQAATGNATDLDPDLITGLAVDEAGHLVISSETRAWTVDLAASTYTHVAGTGVLGFSGDGGDPTLADFNSIHGVAFAPNGDIYISDHLNSRVRRITTLPAAPTDISPDLLLLAENAPNGTVVGTLSATDPNAGDTHNFVLVNQEHAGAFAVSGAGQLSVADGALLDFETDQVHSLTVRVTDNSGLSYEETISVTLIDEAETIITTFAGSGSPGHTGDGGPATEAAIRGPIGIVADAAGNVYFTQSGMDLQFPAIRRVDAETGVIITVAGTGVSGFSGDGGPATAAQLGGPHGVALDSAGNLFIADTANHRIRRVDAVTGIITTIAGNGLAGFTGDNVPATATRLRSPTGVAVDSEGNVFIADRSNFRIRRVDAQTGIITTVVGETFAGDSGDGGPASAARLREPRKVAFDAEDNLFILDRSATVSQRIRRVDAETGIITTVAGGGATVATSGNATDLNLGWLTDLAVDNAGQLFISSVSPTDRVWRVNLATSTTESIAGMGSEDGFSGDGGDPKQATFSNIEGLAVAGNGDLFLSDTGNQRVRRITTPVSTPTDVVIDVNTPQDFLDQLTSVTGSVFLTNVGGRTLLVLPNLQFVGGDFIVTANPDLMTVEAPMLEEVSGDLNVSDNPSATTVDLGGVSTVGGSVTISGNDSAASVDLGAVSTVGGDLSLYDNDSATTVNLGGVSTVGGDVMIYENVAAATIDFHSLMSIVGSLFIHGNLAATVIDLTALAQVGGGLAIVDNPSAQSVALNSLTSVQGGVAVSRNDSATTIDLGGVTSVGGSIAITDNPAATSIDLGGVTSVGGSVTLSGNDASTTIDLGGVTSVGGAIAVTENPSATSIDLGGVTSVGGSITLSGNDAATTIDLGGVTSVGGEVSITDNPSATTIDLGGVTSVGPNLTIAQNSSATSIDLGGVTSVGGNVTIAQNTSATSIPLFNLSIVGGAITLSGNINLLQINLDGLVEAGAIRITDNHAAQSVSMQALQSTAGSVAISGNGSATSVNLGNVTTVGGSLSVTENDAATSVSLGNVTSVGGNLDVSDNDLVASVNLSNVTTVGGGLSVAENDAATSVNLRNVTSVGATLNFSGNDSATSVDLGNVTTVGGDLVVAENLAATSVDLGNVTTVGGDLQVSGNQSAASVDLGNVTTIGGDLAVTGNIAAVSVDLGNVTTVGGALTVSTNVSATSVALGNVTTVGGALVVSTNVSATSVALGNVTSVGGDVTLAENDAAGLITMAALQNAPGFVTVTSNDSAELINFGGLRRVGGSLVVSGNSSARNIDFGDLQTVGSSLFTIDAVAEGMPEQLPIVYAHGFNDDGHGWGLNGGPYIVSLSDVTGGKPYIPGSANIETYGVQYWAGNNGNPNATAAEGFAVLNTLEMLRRPGPANAAPGEAFNPFNRPDPIAYFIEHAGDLLITTPVLGSDFVPRIPASEFLVGLHERRIASDYNQNGRVAYHAEDLRDVLREEFDDGKFAGLPQVNFMTHSAGGLETRAMLDLLQQSGSQQEAERVANVLYAAPPFGGSTLGELITVIFDGPVNHETFDYPWVRAFLAEQEEGLEAFIKANVLGRVEQALRYQEELTVLAATQASTVLSTQNPSQALIRQANDAIMAGLDALTLGALRTAGSTLLAMSDVELDLVGVAVDLVKPVLSAAMGLPGFPKLLNDLRPYEAVHNHLDVWQPNLHTQQFVIWGEHGDASVNLNLGPTLAQAASDHNSLHAFGDQSRQHTDFSQMALRTDDGALTNVSALILTDLAGGTMKALHGFANRRHENIHENFLDADNEGVSVGETLIESLLAPVTSLELSGPAPQADEAERAYVVDPDTIIRFVPESRTFQDIFDRQFSVTPTAVEYRVVKSPYSETPIYSEWQSIDPETFSFSFSSLKSQYGVSPGEHFQLNWRSVNQTGGREGIRIATFGSGDALGSLTISGNLAAAVELGSLTSVIGNLTLATQAQSAVDLSRASVGGNLTFDGRGTTLLAAMTASQDTDVTLANPQSTMAAALPTGAFASPVDFSVAWVEPASLAPAPGQDASGSAAVIDPVAAYQFEFADSTLDENASLSFEIDVAALGANDRDAFLQALAAGNATMAVKGDAPGSVYDAFEISAPGEPSQEGRVAIARLDANRNPIPEGSGATPAFVRFEGATSHFSTFAVVIVELPGDYNRNGAVDAADYVLWRKTPTVFGGEPGYNDWRANFGRTRGAESPEPGAGSQTTAVLPDSVGTAQPVALMRQILAQPETVVLGGGAGFRPSPRAAVKVRANAVSSELRVTQPIDSALAELLTFQSSDKEVEGGDVVRTFRGIHREAHELGPSDLLDEAIETWERDRSLTSVALPVFRQLGM